MFEPTCKEVAKPPPVLEVTPYKAANPMEAVIPGEAPFREGEQGWDGELPFPITAFFSFSKTGPLPSRAVLISLRP